MCSFRQCHRSLRRSSATALQLREPKKLKSADLSPRAPKRITVSSGSLCLPLPADQVGTLHYAHQNRGAKRTQQARRGLQISIVAVVGVDPTYGKITRARWRRLDVFLGGATIFFSRIRIMAVSYRLSNKIE
jgi:hypothetical protein